MLYLDWVLKLNNLNFAHSPLIGLNALSVIKNKCSKVEYFI